MYSINISFSPLKCQTFKKGLRTGNISNMMRFVSVFCCCCFFLKIQKKFIMDLTTKERFYVLVIEVSNWTNFSIWYLRKHVNDKHTLKEKTKRSLNLGVVLQTVKIYLSFTVTYSRWLKKTKDVIWTERLLSDCLFTWPCMAVQQLKIFCHGKLLHILSTLF